MREYHLCQLENTQLKSFIKRYKKLIAERENGHDHDHDHGPTSRNDTMMDRHSSQSGNEIDRQLYKYGLNQGVTPKLGILRGTATSFGMTRPPAFTELKKAEQLNQNMALIQK